MNYWLVKSEPAAYSWQNLETEGIAVWDGVRNYQARNYMKQMSVGDRVLFYHSQSERAVVGEAEVVRAHYQDPTTDDVRWVAVDLKPVAAFPNAVSLKEIKKDNKLQNIKLIKQARLSVMPIEHNEFEHILMLSLQEKK